VEFLTETSAHSLAVMKDEKEFQNQVKLHNALIKKYFGLTPTTFRLTELIYSDAIGAQVEKLGYKTMLTEGARHILGWKSPNFIYANAINPKLKILLRNFRLSDDISFRFSNKDWSEWPVTSEKYVSWLNTVDDNEEIVNLFMDYETFGEHQAASSGIFEFMRNLPKQVFAHSNFEFLTPSEVYDKHQPVAAIHVPFAVSWADEERDLSAWLGNELQDDAFDTLYSLSEKLQNISDPELINTWLKLQNSDHFYYMCTKWFSDGNVHKYFNPYSSPYDAYINYMNVLSDFIKQIDSYAETDETAKKKKLLEYIADNKDSEYNMALFEYSLSQKTLAELKESGIIKSKPILKTAEKKAKLEVAEKIIAKKTAKSDAKNVSTKKTAKKVTEKAAVKSVSEKKTEKKVKTVKAKRMVKVK
jgi:alpha-amylase